ncbi:MAG: hypothetical protein IT335_04230 [Thermomicrobiales bacterium]|nr:hypothetical protein [Thermomicrobiales bacterium]
MSARVAGLVWQSSLSRLDKYLMLALADHAHDDGSHVFPSVPMVAWKTMYEERQVRRRLREFEELGYLVRETEGMGGRGRSTLYRIDLDALPMREPWRSVNPDIAVSPFSGPDMSINPDILSIKGDISDTKGGHFEQKPGHFEHKGGHSYVHLNIETSKKRNKQENPETRMTAGWLPDSGEEEWALETLGIGPKRFALELDGFRDHFIDKGIVRKSWRLSFRKWLRNAAMWNPPREEVGECPPGQTRHVRYDYCVEIGRERLEI